MKIREAILYKAMPQLLGKINALLYLRDRSQDALDSDLIALVGFTASIDLTKFSAESLKELQVLVQRIFMSIIARRDLAKFDRFR